MSCDSTAPNLSDQNFSTTGIFPGGFPEGLRVLVVNEDHDYLSTLENQLRELQYEVTTCAKRDEALSLLRDGNNVYDMVIVDVHHLKADIYEFLSRIRSETDLPVIVMSSDHSVDSVFQSVMNGASDYLIKPIRPEVLRTLYKHVVKRALNRTAHMDDGDNGESLSCDLTSTNQRRSLGEDEDNDNDNDEVHGSENEKACISRKRRLVWSSDLHSQFVAAVDQLGIDNAVPKRILELMNDDRLNRENVASHLQKYRINIKRQKAKNVNCSYLSHQETSYVYAPSSFNANSSLMYENATGFNLQTQDPNATMATKYLRAQAARVPHMMNSLTGVNQSVQTQRQTHPSSSHQTTNHVLHELPPPLGQPLTLDGVSDVVPGSHGFVHHQTLTGLASDIDLVNIDNGSGSNMGTVTAFSEENVEMSDILLDWNITSSGYVPLDEQMMPFINDFSSRFLDERCLENIGNTQGPLASSSSSSSIDHIQMAPYQSVHTSLLSQQENVRMVGNGGFYVNGYSVEK